MPRRGRSDAQSFVQADPRQQATPAAVGGLARTLIVKAMDPDSFSLLGCSALKELDPGHGEVKSMRTSSAHRRKGVARAMPTHIIAEVRHRSYARLGLETGSLRAFVPAQRLYASFGFVYCPPFAEYVEDPNSVFMTRAL